MKNGSVALLHIARLADHLRRLQPSFRPVPYIHYSTVLIKHRSVLNLVRRRGAEEEPGTVFGEGQPGILIDDPSFRDALHSAGGSH